MGCIITQKSVGYVVYLIKSACLAATSIVVFIELFDAIYCSEWVRGQFSTTLLCFECLGSRWVYGTASKTVVRSREKRNDRGRWVYKLVEPRSDKSIVLR
jgi:hypothetical protein